RITLVHQKAACVGQIERTTTERGEVDVVDIACNDLRVVQRQRRNDRACAFDRRLVEVDTHDLPTRADHLCQHGERSTRTTSARDRSPPYLHPYPPQGRAQVVREQFRKAQKPTKVFVAAIMDVAPDPLRDGLAHDSYSLPRVVRD